MKHFNRCSRGKSNSVDTINDNAGFLKIINAEIKVSFTQVECKYWVCSFKIKIIDSYAENILTVGF